jgi:hypothetical protein
MPEIFSGIHSLLMIELEYVVYDICAGFDLNLSNTCGSGMSSALDLDSVSPGLAVHFE